MWIGEKDVGGCGCRGDILSPCSEGMLYALVIALLCDGAYMLESLNPGSRLESLAIPRDWPSTA